MKYRGLTYDGAEGKHRYIYGLPSYGFETDEIAEIGTIDGGFTNINPATLGRGTGYTDCTGKEIFTGDITELVVDGQKRHFEVVETTTDREYNTLTGFDGTTVKVRLKGVIAFKWAAGKETYYLLPCVDKKGNCDTERMRIVGDIHTKAERESNEDKGKKQ